jgi:hypothetical protein
MYRIRQINSRPATFILQFHLHSQYGKEAFEEKRESSSRNGFFFVRGGAYEKKYVIRNETRVK